MQQQLFIETMTDALTNAVNALGGFKKVGATLRPELPTDQAGNWLRDCLRSHKRDKLSPEQCLAILRMARAVGHHEAMNWVNQQCGYRDPEPLEPEDERARLQREYIEATRSMARLAERMEKVNSMRAVA